MLKAAYIFPGQGAQYVGMGEDFYRNLPAAKEVFEQANSILGFDLNALIFKGPIEELTRTVNCQLAIFTVSVAALRAVAERKPQIDVAYTAGLSLGEYAALTAAGAFSFAQGLKLVRARAEYMEEATGINPGGMVSIIGLTQEAVEDICRETKTEIANLNCPGQVVISGPIDALENVAQLAKARAAKGVIPLKVSGGFHSSLMAPASEKLKAALEKAEICSPKIPVVSNVTAGVEISAEEIKDNLSRQLIMRTRWEDSIKFISAQGVRNFFEIGPGKVLAGLLRRIDPELTVYNIEKMQDIEHLHEAPNKSKNS